MIVDSSEDNKVWNAMECLLPCSPHFLNLNDLEPLFHCAMTIPMVKRQFLSETLGIVDLDAECCVYRRILLKEYDKGVFLHENHKKVDLNKVCAFMVKAHIDCAPVLTMLYRVAATAGYASGPVECLFSALTKVDAPQRRRQATKRESNLTFLHFERTTLMSLGFDDC